MIIETIKEGVLNDDILYIAEKDRIFKGGFVAILKYYTFQNNWCNKEHIKRFKTLENAYKFINKY